ncbi:hypothetical protein [Pseudomonas mediterranea]|uniref:hypothetical protein n=1 Tax=Pseudomonas mediterranea TaxID=183795 RepID=UPI0006D89109|nr:hypothetical protein [Pseudomonas mediterranea]
MSRKVTEQAVSAFLAGRVGCFNNTTVELSPLGKVVVLKLHGNAIARRDLNGNHMEVCNGGWSSNTTKERLNGIPGVRVNQKNFEWFLNGVEWDGGWTVVGAQ